MFVFELVQVCIQIKRGGTVCVPYRWHCGLYYFVSSFRSDAPYSDGTLPKYVTTPS